VTGADRPVLRVVRGNPSPEEVAALVTVVTARRAATSSAGRGSLGSAWTDRSRLLRSCPRPGPGAWRTSAR
jgi:hypothetical protein